MKEYSFALTRLLQYVVDILKVRKEDILQRHSDQRAAIKNRNKIIHDNKEIEKERKKALKKAKQSFGKKEGEEGEDEKEDEKEEEEEEKKEDEEEKKEEGEGEEGVVVEGFNEEEWLTQYNLEHPITPVPEEVFVDQDNDFDVEENIEGEGEEGKEEED